MGDENRIEKKIESILEKSNSHKDIRKLYELVDLDLYPKIKYNIPDINPLNPLRIKRFSSNFGYRTHPIYKTKKFHYGIDISCKKGTPVHSPANGKIIVTSYKNTGYGNEIKIKHKYGFVTRYAHLHQIKIKNGIYVKKGDIIGTVGTTGVSTAPHLHYEIFKNGNRIDPKKMIDLTNF